MKFSVFLKTHFLLLSILALSTVLRFFHLDYQSIWDDEIATMIESNPGLSWREFFEVYFNNDNMPPLYFFLLRGIFSIFGYTSLNLRIFSAVFGVLGIYAVYLLGHRLSSRLTGLIAALLLAVNITHIQYSQEGRPYSFFVCFTIFSFYALIKFISSQERKHLFQYVFFTALMLYGQYFGLIILFSQCLLLFYFLIISNRDRRKTFLLKSIIAGIAIGILYIPALPQLFRNFGFTTSWIPAPGPDIFTSIFASYFGGSELLIATMYVLLISFFILLFNERTGETKDSLNKFKSLEFSFIVLITWIMVYLLTLLIRSYLVLPMIIPRYLLCLLPAVLLMAALALANIRSGTICGVFLFLIFLFSVTDLLAVKKYYHTLTKAQYRENAAFINKHRKPNEPVVARVGWHYGHFIKGIEWLNLEKYLNKIEADTVQVNSFWYAGVHEPTPELSEKTKLFLDQNFVLTTKSENFEVQAFHYSRKR